MTTINFDKKVKCGPEFVSVRILQNFDDLKIGAVWLPTTAGENERLAHAVIENIGETAAEKYGLAAGDYVMIDRLSTFAHTAPVALLKYNNVICKTDADMSDFWPVKDMLFVEEDDKDPISKVGNVFVPGYTDKLNVGTVTKTACSPEVKSPFKAGDKVLVTKGADVVQLGTRVLRIYKHDMIICAIEN